MDGSVGGAGGGGESCDAEMDRENVVMVYVEPRIKQPTSFECAHSWRPEADDFVDDDWFIIVAMVRCTNRTYTTPF